MNRTTNRTTSVSSRLGSPRKAVGTAALVAATLLFAACGDDDGAEVRDLSESGESSGSGSASETGSPSGSGSASASGIAGEEGEGSESSGEGQDYTEDGDGDQSG